MTKIFQILTALSTAGLLFCFIVWLPLLVHCCTLLMVWITFRQSQIMAIAALEQSVLKNPIFIPNKVYRNLTLIFLVMYCLSLIISPLDVSGFLAISVGLLFLAKLKELHYRELLRHNGLRLYYICQLVGSMGYLWLGITQLSNKNTFGALTLISVGYLCVASTIFRKISYSKISIVRNCPPA